MIEASTINNFIETFVEDVEYINTDITSKETR